MSYTIEARRNAKLVRSRLMGLSRPREAAPMIIVSQPQIEEPLPKVEQEEQCISKVLLAPTFRRIMAVVAKHQGIEPTDLMRRTRVPKIVNARHLLIILSLRLNPNRTISSIGRKLKQDHTTIMNARDKTLKNMVENASLVRSIAELERILLYGDNH